MLIRTRACGPSPVSGPGEQLAADALPHRGRVNEQVFEMGCFARYSQLHDGHGPVARIPAGQTRTEIGGRQRELIDHGCHEVGIIAPMGLRAQADRGQIRQLAGMCPADRQGRTPACRPPRCRAPGPASGPRRTACSSTSSAGRTRSSTNGRVGVEQHEIGRRALGQRAARQAETARRVQRQRAPQHRQARSRPAWTRRSAAGSRVSSPTAPEAASSNGRRLLFLVLRRVHRRDHVDQPRWPPPRPSPPGRLPSAAAASA